MKKHHLLTLASLLALTCSLNAESRIEKRAEHAKGTQSQQNLVLHNEEQEPRSLIASSCSKKENTECSIPEDEASVPPASRTPPPPSPQPPQNPPQSPPPPAPPPQPTPRRR